MADGDPTEPDSGPPLSGEDWGTSADPAARATPFASDNGARYGRGGVLGTGGMGVVYAATDARLARQVALKVAHDPALGRRMAREARITAQLEHPGIVAVYDAGQDPDGRPWYAMRLIRGRSLDARLQEAGDLAGRLTLLRHYRDACEAVAYAHALGIVHRDLKSANILVGEFGETQVADWGLARPIRAEEERWDAVLQEIGGGGGTQVGAVVGTPVAMSPEQARGEAVDARSDVWSLGVVLVELLRGGLDPAAPHGVAMLAARRAGMAPSLADLDPDTPAELIAIARKALQPDPAARYPDARALARDIADHLDGRRVSAHHYTAGELLSLALRPWRVPLLVAAAAAVLVAIVGVVASVRTAEERNRAVAAEAEARGALAVAAASLGEALVQQAVSAVYADARPEAEVLAAHALLQGEDPTARGVLAAYGGAARPVRVSRRPLPDGCDGSLALSEDGRLLLCTSRRTVGVWDLEAGTWRWRREEDARAVQWLPDGRVAVLPDAASGVRVLDADGALAWTSDRPGAIGLALGPAPSMVVTGGEAALAVVDAEAGTTTTTAACPSAVPEPLPGPGPVLRRCDDGTLRAYDARGVEVRHWTFDPARRWSAFDRVGERLVYGTFEGRTVVADLATGRTVHALDGFDGPVVQFLLLPGTPLALARGERGGPRVWDLETGGWLGALPGRPTAMARGAAPGEVVLVTDAIETWRLPLPPRPWAVDLGAGLSALDVAVDAPAVAWASGAGEVGLVRLDPWTEAVRARWQGKVAKGATTTDDGALLFGVGVGAPGGRLFDARTGEPRGALTAPSGFAARRVGGLRGGLLWGLGYGRGTTVWRAETGEPVAVFDEQDFFEGASSPDRAHAAWLSSDGGVWRIGEELVLERILDDDEARAVDISADGATLVLGHAAAVCRVVPARGERRCFDLDARLLDVALSPDDRRAAIGTLAGDVLLLELDSGQLRAILRGHTGRVSSVGFLPDGQTVVSGSWDRTLRRWDLSRLDTPAAALVAEVEAAWGMDLDAALRRR